MTAEKTWLDILAARCARGLSNETLEKFRGRRESRMLTAPAASRANEKSTRASHHRYAETIRPSLRDGLRLIRDLPGVHDFLVTVARAMRTHLSANLTPAKGCQDHTISPSASVLFAKNTSASIASRAQRFVTMAKRPSYRARDP